MTTVGDRDLHDRDARTGKARPAAIGHWIGGRRVPGGGSRHGDVYNPATGDVTGRVAFATEADVDEAVATAVAAFPTWRETAVLQRTRLIFTFRGLLERRARDLAAVITAEHGKTRADALGEVTRGLEVVEFACGIAHLLKGEFSDQVSSGVDTYSLRQPLGVCAGITPFNFPVMVPLWMFPLAVAAGNTFVLKPSERDPSAPLLLAELVKEAGFPDGVLNVVQGDRVAVDALLTHRDVAAVSFVGSTPVARHVWETGTSSGKRVQALGGAKNHMVVLPDADMDLAADAATSAAYGSAGERCMAISAVVAVGDAGDRLVDRVRERVARLKVGDGREPSTDMGPLVTREHRDRVASYVDKGLAAGARLVVDGRDVTVEGSEGGFFLGPCLFDHVTPDMEIYTDEIFGPVLVVVRAESHHDAIALVNSNPYGNGTAVFTSDGAAARTFQREVTVGMVGINVAIPVPISAYSFGGWKSSLFGDTHVYGMDGVRFYTRSKVVTSRWPEPADPGVDLGFLSSR